MKIALLLFNRGVSKGINSWQIYMCTLFVENVCKYSTISMIAIQNMIQLFHWNGRVDERMRVQVLYGCERGCEVVLGWIKIFCTC